MRDDGPSRRSWLLLTAAIACAGLLILMPTQSANAQEQQEAETSLLTEERILPNEVTLDNLEAFQEQMRRDLPVGTPKADVGAYLARWDISHHFFGTNYGSLGNSFHAVLEDLGIYHGYTPRLNAWIDLDDTNLVREIRFHLKFL